MFANAKLADTVPKVKPDALRQRETRLRRIEDQRFQAAFRDLLLSSDLNYSNRPVRTRMPGGVGGDRSGFLTDPYPDSWVLVLRCAAPRMSS